MRRSRRSRMHGLGAAFGTTEIITVLAAGGLVAYLLWPKSAKAEGRPRPRPAEGDAGTKEPTPAPAAGGGMPAPNTPVFTDPSTGVAIAGPSTDIVPPAVGAADIIKTLEKGESWSNLASRAYNDYRWWPFLWDYNRSSSTTFENPDVLRRGEVVKIPAAPPEDPAFKAAIFARAAAHRRYWLDGRKGPLPAIVLERTAVPTASVNGYRLGYGCAGC